MLASTEQTERIPFTFYIAAYLFPHPFILIQLSCCLFSQQIFRVFVLRIQDCNKKVKQQALEVLAWMTSMLRDALHPQLVSLVEAVTENLNSKHPGIYAASVKALEAFIDQLGKADLWHGLSSTVASASQSQANTESVDSCCRLWKYPSAARCLGSTACIVCPSLLYHVEVCS